MMIKLLPALLAFAANFAVAGEIVGADLARQDVTASLRDPNIFSVEGRAIRSVGRIQGAVDHLINPASGNAHIWFPTDTAKPALVVITDDAGVEYMIALNPQDVPGERFTIAPGAANRQPASATTTQTNRLPSRLRAIKALVRRMYQPAKNGRELAVPVPLWNEAIFVLRAKHNEGGMAGERYSLCNASGSDMVLSERELDRPSVLAVSIEHHTLTPTKCTDVVIVHDARGRE